MSTDQRSTDELSARLQRVEQQLDAVHALETARGLLHNYARGCDTKQPDAVAAGFAANALLTAGTAVFEGREAILGFYESALQGNSCHVVGAAHMVTAADGTIESSAVFCSVHLAGEVPAIHYGTYDDRIAVSDGRAEFVSRTITITGSVPIPQ